MGLGVAVEWEFANKHKIVSAHLAAESGDLVVADADRTVFYIDPQGKELWRLEFDNGLVGVRVAQKGAPIYALTVDGHLALLNKSGDRAWREWIEREPMCLGIRPAGQAAVVGSHTGRMHIVSQFGKRTRLIHTPAPVIFAAYTNPGTLFVASRQGWVSLYAKTLTPIFSLDLDQMISGIAVNMSGTEAFFPSGTTGISVISLEEMSRNDYDTKFHVAAVAVDAEGKLMLAAGSDGELALLDPEAKIVWYTHSKKPVFTVQMTATGKRFVTISETGMITSYAAGNADDNLNRDRLDFLEIG